MYRVLPEAEHSLAHQIPMRSTIVVVLNALRLLGYRMR
jgi:hypothetical protein